jgi:methyl-accepting chemotaxis protein
MNTIVTTLGNTTMRTLLKKNQPIATHHPIGEKHTIEKKQEIPNAANSNLIEKQEEYAKTIRDIINGQYTPIQNCDDPVCNVLDELHKHLTKIEHNALEDMVEFSMQASETLAAISFVTGDIREVFDNTQAIAAAIEELSATSSDISKNSNNVVDNSRTTQGAISSGEEAVEKSVENINLIAKSMDTANQKIHTLSEAVQAIVEILTTIENIAKQTNLLALNATIEAARAGEAGKGFAVVATEVKTLAGQTAEATEDIKEKIHAISSGMDDVSNAMIESVQATDLGRSSIHKTGEEITQVVKNVQNTTELMTSVASSVTEQDAAIHEIAQSIEIIKEKTDKASTNADFSSDITLKTAQMTDEKLSTYREMDIPNSILDFAKSDHVIWKKNLGAMLSGKTSLTADQLTDYHHCALGKWYDGVDDPNINNHPSFIELKKVHAKVHNHGKTCAELFAKGDRLGAIKEYESMSTASDVVLRCLTDIKNHLSRR